LKNDSILGKGYKESIDHREEFIRNLKNHSILGKGYKESMDHREEFTRILNPIQYQGIDIKKAKTMGKNL